MSQNESTPAEPALPADPPASTPAVSAPSSSLPDECPAELLDDLGQPAPAAPPAPPGERRGAALREWITRSEAIAAARSQLAERPAPRRRMIERARLAEEGAERALNPVDPFRNGPGVSLALSLYREALYWGLRAQPEVGEAADLPSAWKQAPRELLAQVTQSPEQAEAIEQGLVGTSFAQTAELTAEQQRELAWQARPFVGALLDRTEGGERELGRLQVQRWLRGLLAFVVVLVVAAGLGYGGYRVSLGPNLANGKPWKASSAYRGFDAVTHVCDGNATEILFHTNEEDSPWFEIDLGSSVTVGSVEIRNRTDSLQDRAVPLAVEVSEDHQKWTEVTRRTETFNSWRVKFPPRKARYVRVRALRRTFLHLENVAVRAR